MKYSSKGLIKSTLQDYLIKWTNSLKSLYGQNFVIKKEGAIDNLATSSSLSIMDLESILMFLFKNINPKTAEDEYQDNLYKLIGLEREYATFTIFQRTLQGNSNTIAPKGSILIENTSTKDQFKLNDDLQFDENGIGIGSFQAEELGAINVDKEDILNIITAPNGVLGIYYTVGNEIKLGRDYESNSEYRLKWEDNQSFANSDTTGGTTKSLLSLVENSKQIKIRQNRATKIYDDVPLHSMNIVINSAYDDETIAQKILDSLKDGVGLVGDIELELKDNFDNPEIIAFSRANPIECKFYVKVVLKEDINIAMVSGLIKTAIKDNFNVGMSDDIIANKFIYAISSINGIDYVEEIKVNNQDIFVISDIEIAKLGDIDVTN